MVNYNHTVLKMSNYDRKSFNVQATGYKDSAWTNIRLFARTVRDEENKYDSYFRLRGKSVLPPDFLR
jgi:hypothetical protein